MSLPRFAVTPGHGAATRLMAMPPGPVTCANGRWGIKMDSPLLVLDLGTS